jgi:autotransporter-associated beta strand protein
MILTNSTAANVGVNAVRAIVDSTSAFRQFMVYSATTISSVISGAIGLIKNGSGTLTLTGANTYTGTTTINAGTMNVSGAGQLNNGIYAGNIVNNGVFTWSSSANQTINGSVGGAGTLNLTPTSAGTLTINGAVTGGNMTIGGGGTVALNGGVTGIVLLSVQNATLTQAGGTMAFGGNTPGLNLGTTANATWTITGGTSIMTGYNAGANIIGNATTSGTLNINGPTAVFSAGDVNYNAGGVINVQEGNFQGFVHGSTTGLLGINLGNNGNTGTATIRPGMLAADFRGSSTVSALGGYGITDNVFPQINGLSSCLSINLMGNNGQISNVQTYSIAGGSTPVNNNRAYIMFAAIKDNGNNRGITFTGPQTAAFGSAPANGSTAATFLETAASYTGTTFLNAGALVADFTITASSNATTASNLLPSASQLQMDNNAVLAITGRPNGTATTGINGTWTSSSYTVTPTSLTGIAVGQMVTGTGIPADTYVTGIYNIGTPSGGAKIYLSNQTTGSGSAAALTFTAQNFNTSQTVNGTVLNSGASAIQVWLNGGNGTVLNLGAITRNPGATVAFTNPTGTLSATNGITTGSGAANTILTDSNVAYATVGTTDWAAKSTTGNYIVAVGGTGTAAVYTAAGNTTLSGNADFNAAGNTTLSTGASITSLRFSNNTAHTITTAAGQTLTTGGILVSSAITTQAQTITGGNLMSAGTGKDLVAIVNSTTGGLTINSTIIDNTSATGLTKSGAGLLTLTNANTYTGTTTITAGTLKVIKTFGAITPTASFTSTTLSVSFSGTLPSGTTNFRLFQGITTGTYASVTLVSVPAGTTATYNSTTSTLTVIVP